MTTFHNFALKAEISWVKKLLKPISETKNANVSRYVWLVDMLVDMYVWFKNLKKYTR